jgi:hypothetical protein
MALLYIGQLKGDRTITLSMTSLPFIKVSSNPIPHLIPLEQAGIRIIPLIAVV